MTKLLLGLGAAFLIAGGATFASTKALPGEMLYGLKTGVVEKVESVFAGTGAARAEFQIKIAERRLFEASQSALKGKFDTAAQEKLLLDFNSQLTGIDAYATELRAAGKLAEEKALMVKLGQSLAMQAEWLAYAQRETASSTDDGSKNSLNFLLLKVGNTLAAAANIAASTLVEDEQPENTPDGSDTDEWGRPI